MFTAYIRSTETRDNTALLKSMHLLLLWELALPIPSNKRQWRCLLAEQIKLAAKTSSLPWALLNAGIWLEEWKYEQLSKSFLFFHGSGFTTNNTATTATSLGETKRKEPSWFLNLEVRNKFNGEKRKRQC